MLRELLGDVHSVSLLVRSSVAGLKFGCALRDAAATRSLCKLCTIPSSNTWTLIQLPSLPLWDAGATWNVQPGNVGYQLSITLSAGTTFTAPAADTWQAGNFTAPPGQSNFAASTGSTFDIAFVQDEPGSQCTTLIDKPFSGANGNYEECLRYYQKTWDYGTAVGTVTNNGMLAFIAPQAQAAATGPHRFLKPMAKIPTVTLYNHTNGTANSVGDNLGANHASASAGFTGVNGFPQINFTTATTAATTVWCHYSADTGW
jgi:hypothetical protein